MPRGSHRFDLSDQHGSQLVGMDVLVCRRLHLRRRHGAHGVRPREQAIERAVTYGLGRVGGARVAGAVERSLPLAEDEAALDLIELVALPGRLNWLTIQVGNNSGAPTAAQMEWIGKYADQAATAIAKLEEIKQKLRR
jgi:hypothetical protein